LQEKIEEAETVMKARVVVVEDTKKKRETTFRRKINASYVAIMDTGHQIVLKETAKAFPAVNASNAEIKATLRENVITIEEDHHLIQEVDRDQGATLVPGQDRVHTLGHDPDRDLAHTKKEKEEDQVQSHTQDQDLDREVNQKDASIRIDQDPVQSNRDVCSIIFMCTNIKDCYSSSMAPKEN